MSTIITISSAWNVTHLIVKLANLSPGGASEGNDTEDQLLEVAHLIDFAVADSTDLSQHDSSLMIFQASPIEVIEVEAPDPLSRAFHVSCRLPSLPLMSQSAVEKVTKNLNNAFSSLGCMSITKGSVSAIEAVQLYMEEAINETMSDTFGQDMRLVRNTVRIDEWLFIHLPSSESNDIHTVWHPSRVVEM